MSLQVVRSGKTSVADLAPEGTFTGVLPHVRLQVVFEVKPASTDVAHERSLLCVSLHVPFQFRSGLEGEVATVTLELRRGWVSGAIRRNYVMVGAET